MLQASRIRRSVTHSFPFQFLHEQTQESTYKNIHPTNKMERFTPHLPWKFYYLFLSFFQMDRSKIEHTLSNYLHVLRFISYHSKVHWDPILQTPISNSHINLQNNNQN